MIVIVICQAYQQLLAPALHNKTRCICQTLAIFQDHTSTIVCDGKESLKREESSSSTDSCSQRESQESDTDVEFDFDFDLDLPDAVIPDDILLLPSFP